MVQPESWIGRAGEEIQQARAQRKMPSTVDTEVDVGAGHGILEVGYRLLGHEGVDGRLVAVAGRNVVVQIPGEAVRVVCRPVGR